jgi:cytochrome c-type protein NapB
MTDHEIPSAPDATTPLPLLIRRRASFIVVLVLGLGVAGYLYGIKEPPPQPTAARSAPPESNVPPVVGYTDLPTARIRPNANYEDHLARLVSPVPRITDPVIRTEEMKQAALADRAANRAYDTAPPTIPHPIDQPASCLACHGNGIWVQDKLATKVSHPHLTNCTQCHVESANDVLAKFDTPPSENEFIGAFRSGPGQRAAAGAPPTIPHTTWMRQDCMSCHGLVARPGIRTTHPWLGNCTQCHVPSATLDQVAFPLPTVGDNQP